MFLCLYLIAARRQTGNDRERVQGNCHNSKCSGAGGVWVGLDEKTKNKTLIFVTFSTGVGTVLREMFLVEQ